MCHIPSILYSGIFFLNSGAQGIIVTIQNAYKINNKKQKYDYIVESYEYSDIGSIIVYMLGLEKYKDSLGKPNEGIHSTRIFGLAFYDIIGMIIIIIILSNWYKYAWLIVPIATVFIHWLFGVNTAFNKWLLDTKCSETEQSC